MNIEYWLKLYLTKQLTPTDVLKLIQQYGNVRNVFTQNAKELSSFLNKNIGGQILHSWEDDTTYKNTMKWLMDQNNRHIITLDSSDYPELLASIPIPPILLFAEGNINLLKNRIFAIVGTRNPTPQGIDNAIHFAKEIAHILLSTEIDAAADSDDQRTVRLAALLVLEAATGFATR
jgi:DNA processing protein